MKKACTILCSTLGGAIIGSAIAILFAPKSGEQMRKDVKGMIVDQIGRLQEQIKSCKCMTDSKEDE